MLLSDLFTWKWLNATQLTLEPHSFACCFLLSHQPPHMGSVMMTQPTMMYTQPVMRPPNPFGPNPGAQVTIVFIYIIPLLLPLSGATCQPPAHTLCEMCVHSHTSFLTAAAFLRYLSTVSGVFPSGWLCVLVKSQICNLMYTAVQYQYFRSIITSSSNTQYISIHFQICVISISDSRILYIIILTTPMFFLRVFLLPLLFLLFYLFILLFLFLLSTCWCCTLNVYFHSLNIDFIMY